MSSDQPRHRPDTRHPDINGEWDTSEDAVLVIRAWHETGTDDQETWHWRGQVSHDSTTTRFVGLGMLFDEIGGILARIASAQRIEDPDG
ncbi:hypothetical protein [Sedimentitalea sp.]|uniref:hypothetical protein n=1 Tax=Sedimentitalea sp. TaxID=2048915 RepID=UPI00329A58AA